MGDDREIRATGRAATKISPGLMELTEVPGLGLGRARTLIEELGIQTLGELEYACRENRLLP